MGGTLTKVDIGHGRGWLAPIPAASLARIDAQLGRLADVNEAGRSPEQADENHRKWIAYLNGGPKAPYALPASQSIHCRGYAVDSDDWYNAAAAEVWRANGWHQTARYPGNPKKDEPWHGEYFPDRDQYYGQPASGGNSMEEDMVNVSEAQLQTLLEGARAATHTRELTGGSIENDDQVIPLLRRAVKAAEATFPNVVGARAILGGSTVDRDGDGKQDEPGVIARLRTILAVVQQLAKSAGIDFDYEAFAAELAPYLELRTLSDGDLKAIATAAADEQDRRDRERLKS